jgi:glycosyltransferase involved in cell wall biosynthesis
MKKIAITGIRGIPACYGGFETFAEELSTRLVKKGYNITVYGRKHVIKHPDKFYRGVKLCILPAPKHKYLETPVHTLLSIIHLLFNRVDVVLVCNAANSPFLWILRLGRIPCVVNLDGIERHRAKWNALGRLWYRLGEITSVWFANKLVSDANVIQKYYLNSYKKSSVVIRYGYSNHSGGIENLHEVLSRKIKGQELLRDSLPSGNILEELGLKAGEYILYVSRLEPENNAHVLIEAYNNLPPDKKQFPLLIVGDAPYATVYKERLKEIAQENVIFAGFRFGEAYQLLQICAYIYVQATEVGGTHPALVEAMGYANCVIANKTPENEEVLQDVGLFYEKNNAEALNSLLNSLLSDLGKVKHYRQAAFQSSRDRFDWNKITNEYEDLFASVYRG